MVAISRRNSMVRSNAVPSGWRRGVPSVSKVGQCMPSQVAWRLPEAKCEVPVTRQPPGAFTARVLPWPQASTSRGAPNTARATGACR